MYQYNSWLIQLLKRAMSWDALRIPTIPQKYFSILETIFVACKRPAEINKQL